jgi:DNA mismatch repair protein MutL
MFSRHQVSNCYFRYLFFSATEMELIQELKLALVNTGFVLKRLVKIMLSFLDSVNVTEQVSLVLEQLLSDLRRNSDSSFSQNDTIAKSMAKAAVKQGQLCNKEQERLG